MKKSYIQRIALWAVLLCLILSGCAGAAAPDTTAPGNTGSLLATEPVITEPDGFVTLPVGNGEHTTEPDGFVTLPVGDPDDSGQEDDRPDHPDYPEQPEQPTQPEATNPAPVPNSSGFKVHFIDVGQADAALVICDGKTMLIDGGNADDSNLMYAFLKNRGVTHLDYVIATHAHEDHAGGLSGALNYATVGKVYCPTTSYSSNAFSNFVKNVQKQGKSITVPSVGTQFALGSAVCSVLAVNTTADTNNTSIVLRIVYGNTSFLFTGDAEREVEQSMINRGVNLHSTVLKVGHHGSSTSSSYQFLWNVMPQYAVISCGKGNSYGHPHDEVLSRLHDAHINVFRTDMQGDITCTSNGSTVSFSVSRNKDADVFEGLGNSYTPPVQPDITPTQPDVTPTQPPQTEQPTDPPSGGGTDCDYILNTNSMKFHDPNCEWAQKISSKNRRDYSGSRDDLLEQGYSPCGSCRP